RSTRIFSQMPQVFSETSDADSGDTIWRTPRLHAN
ncbi:MAG: hypothetical protein ACI8RZ_006062, partial [Myxococcota bacterium]